MPRPQAGQHGWKTFRSRNKNGFFILCGDKKISPQKGKRK
jgi:hypothetical protein